MHASNNLASYIAYLLIDIGICIQLAADHLRKSYVESRHNVSVDEWPPYQPKHYTTLALIHVEKHTSTEVISVTKKLASKGKIENKDECVLRCHDDNIFYQSKRISEIFSKKLSTGRYLILIEGAPGIGKTVLSKEIAFQWANNTLLRNIKLVLFVFLRDPNLKNVNSLEDLMAHVFKVNSINSLPTYLFKTKGKDVAIILDGYDEISEEQRQNSFIAGIINCNVLPECSLIITSRPTASAHLHTMAHCRVEILGFTEADRLEYIQHALQGNDGKIQEITSYLQSHSTINAFCYIPLNMTILLSLFEETFSQTNLGRLPNTQTEMCEHFIRVIITRFIRKILRTEFVSAPELSDLPEPHNKVFYELSKLAYDALIKDQIVFTIKEINKACPHLVMRCDNWNGLGLIRAAQHGIDSVSFHFLHFSIQEYMAAYFIASMPDKEQLKLLKNTFWDIHYFNTWIMYVGITRGESFAWKHFLSGNWLQLSTRLSKSSSISKKLLRNKVKCLHLLQCFQEGNSESTEQLVQSFFQERTIDLSNQTLHPKDVNILGCFLLRSINKYWKKINLSRCNLRDVGCNILCKMFMDKTNRKMLKVDEVDFSYNYLQFHTIIALLDVFRSWNTTDAILCGDSNASYETSKELEYFQEIIFNITENCLQSVSIGQSLYGNKTTQTNMLNHLTRSTHFTALYLYDCIWQENSLPNGEFVDLLKKQKLTTIHIIGKTNAYCIKDIVEAVKQVGTIFIYDNTLADAEVDKIGNVLLEKVGNSRSDVALVIGRNKIIGKLNTSSLNTELSSPEIYCLFANIKNLCSNPNEPLVDFKFIKHYSIDSQDLHNLFMLLQNNPMQCQVSICLVDNNILVAHKCKCEEINERLYNHPASLNSVYISHCDFYKNIQFRQFIDLISEQNLLVNCYILNSNMDADFVESFCSKLVQKDCGEEKYCHYTLIFHSIHPSCELFNMHTFINFDHFGKVVCTKKDKIIILVTRDAFLGYNITYDLLLVTLHLQSQVKAWKFWHCNLDYEILQLIINYVQPVETNCCLTELDFTGCIVVDDIKSCVFKNTQSFACLTKLSIYSFIEFHRIIEDMAMFLLHNTQLKELHISNLKLDLKDFKILANSLKGHSNLSKLTISYIGKVLDEDIAVILSNNIKLEEVDLSGLKTENFLIIAKSMKNILQLKILNISNSNVTANDIGEIISHNTNLEHLNLSNLSLCFQDFMNISLKMKNISNLKSLDISRNSAHNNIFDDSSEATDNVVDHSNTDNIAVIFSHNLQLEELNLSNLCLSSKDFVKIASEMNNISKLRKLHISDNNIDDNAINAMIILLLCNIDLEMLDISTISLHKVEDVIKVAKVMHKRAGLSKVSICCDEITNDAADAIAVILPYNKNLRKVEVIVNDLAIKISNNLTEFVLETEDINKQAAYTVAALLSNNTTLEIGLKCCTIQATDAAMIFKSMKNISTLREFIIYSSRYAYQAANAIAEIFDNNRQLRVIDLSYNDLRPVGAIKIFNGMENFSYLIKLDISHNDITDKEAYEGRYKISPVLSQLSHLTTKPVTYTAVLCLASVIDHNPRLQYLNIGNLYLDSKETIVIFNGMKKLTNLVELNISESNVTNDAAKIIASILLHNANLRKLYLTSCSLKTEGAMDILNAIRNHSCLTKLNIINNDEIGDEAKAVLRAIHSINPKLYYHS